MTEANSALELIVVNVGIFLRLPRGDWGSQSVLVDPLDKPKNRGKGEKKRRKKRGKRKKKKRKERRNEGKGHRRRAQLSEIRKSSGFSNSLAFSV